MVHDMCTRRLTRELRAIQKAPLTNPTVHTTPLDSNILEWHYVIEGHSNSPFEGGYYWGKLIFPKEYPLKPPSVMMLTKNGRFHTGKRLCLSMSDFHPETWNPMWSVSTIITGLISFMVESTPTTGSMTSSTLQKQKYARQSLAENVKDTTFCKLFPHLVEVHEEMEQKRKINGIVHPSPSVSNSNTMPTAVGNGDIMAICAGFIALLSIICAMRFI